MANIGKEKFSRLGVHELLRTTYAGEIELMLKYDVAGNYFYFEASDIKGYIPGYTLPNINFRTCDTRMKAVALFKNYISDSLIGHRMLRVKLSFNESIFKKVKKNEKQHIVDMSDSRIRGDGSPSGFSISFERIMRYGEEGGYSYCKCNDNWHTDLSYHSSYGVNVIDWDEETENFLIKMQQELDKLCDNVIKFFSTDSLEQLREKIRQAPLMIGASGES